MPKTTDRIGRVRDRALELGVYLPLGAYAVVRDEITNLNAQRLRKTFDGLIDRGQERLEPLERVVRRRARTETRRVERTVDEATTEVRKTARRTGKRAEAAADAIAPKLPRVAAPRSVGQLPIQGYNNLTASEIVAQLRGLTQTDLAKIYKWERAHENRSTILEAIDAKFVDLPIPTYDSLNVDEITTRLEGLSESDLKTIRRYEGDTKQRQTVLDKIDSLL